MNLIQRATFEQQELERLAPYASKSAQSKGRDVPEKPDRLRTEFQRDRDRVLHSGAFRKLEYKTQVYVTHEGDYFRTRLTHTLEAGQIARTLARSLNLNPDLTEAIALAHDLGHTPFGHTGEAVLNELLADMGGFEHNAQSLRVVEVLEDRFVDRPGLNLTWEVREGIACHSTAVNTPAVCRYLNGSAPSLEAQLIDVADEIAYSHHDLDDALGMGLVQAHQLRQVPWVWELWESERTKHPAAEETHIKFRVLGSIIDLLVNDVLEHTGALLEQRGIQSPEAVRNEGARLAQFSPKVKQLMNELGTFLSLNVYRHPTTLKMQSKAARFLQSLFHLYLKQPEMLPRAFQARIDAWGLKRVLTDYLSGMTDRSCLEDYITQFEPTLGWIK